MDDKLKVRKHFVFLLNSALDLQKKYFVGSDDLIAFSNEVRNFNETVQKSTLNTSLKSDLERIQFYYTPARSDVSSIAFVTFATIFTGGIYYVFRKLQVLHRKRMLGTFLNDYENLLKAF